MIKKEILRTGYAFIFLGSGIHKIKKKAEQIAGVNSTSIEKKIKERCVNIE